MRFVIAIAAFVAAAIMIGAGFAQRTIWAPPSEYSVSSSLPQGADFVVVGGGTLNALEGQQVLRVSGSSDPFVAYGRTADVLAWLKGTPFVRLSYQGDSDRLAVTSYDADGTKLGGSASPQPTDPASTPPATGATGDAAAGTTPEAGPTVPALPVPDGSDLWLQQFTGPAAGTTRLNVPDSVSVIIAGSEGAPAPRDVRITWPLSSATPWSGPLIVGGAALLLVGLILYLLALRGMRRSRGPRRGGKPPRMPRTPRSRRIRAVAASVPGNHGRRSTRRSLVAVPVVLAGALALTGCTSDSWPSFGDSPTPTASVSPLTTDAPAGADAPQPAVTEPQLQEIVDRVAKVASEADANGDAGLAATRFTGAALTERTVNYQIRKKLSSYPKPQAIPTGDVQIALPQATDAWPRVVSAVVRDASDAKQPPLDLVLVQQTPRDNYKVQYAISLGAVEGIDLPPASVGTTLMDPASNLLTVAPDKLATAYSGVFAKGRSSMYYPLFDENSDTLAPQLGAGYKQKQLAKAAKDKSSTLTFTDAPGIDQPIALATNDSGALVATTFDETAARRVTQKGATVSISQSKGSAGALIGKTTSSTGLSVTQEYQVLFYVPPAGSDQKIRLIGYTQAAIAAQELK